MKNLLLVVLSLAPAFCQPISVGIKGGILLNAPSTEDNRATLDVSRWTVGPTIEIRLPARFSAALDAALYRRTSFSTGRSIGGEQFFDTSHTTEWGFPLYAKYRFTEVPFHPFVAGGAAFKYLRTTGTAGCSGTEPSLCGPNPGVSNLVITSPIG